MVRKKRARIRSKVGSWNLDKVTDEDLPKDILAKS
jgi:hypothetical protein